MIPLVLSPEEVRAALDGKLTEIRRPIEGLPPDPQNVRFALYLKCDAPPGTGTVSLRIECPWGGGWAGPDYDQFAEVLFVQESWRSWRETCDDEDAGWYEEHAPGPHCDQTYVAYEATPRSGYRPVPDRAAITYLHETSPIERNPKLLGPWEPAESMPPAFSRLALRNRGVRVERVGGVWQWVVAIERVAEESRP